MKVESKVGKINRSAEQIYTLLADFRNFQHMIPLDKVQDFEATESECSFSIQPVGKVKLVHVEKEPFSLIKIKADGIPQNVSIWIQLKESAPYVTHVKVTLELEINAMMGMMLKPKAQKGIDQMVEMLEKM